MLDRKKSYDDISEKSLDEVLKLYDNFQIPAKTNKEEAWNRLVTSIEKNNNTVAFKTRSLKRAWIRLNINTNEQNASSLSAEQAGIRPLKINFVRMKKYYFAAAIILLLIGFSTLKYITSETIISSQNAENLLATLPDGSTVELNAASKIQFKKNGWDKNRKVKLSGEAFFKVKKGKSFEVITSDGNIKVLGTSFNVYARNHKLLVVCKTGKVRVVANDTVFLTAGMKASSTNRMKIETKNANLEREAAWQKGEFWYNNAPLDEVFEEIERQFNIVVKYSGLQNRKYTGYFNKQSLQNSLTSVCSPMQLNFKKENENTYIIY